MKKLLLAAACAAGVLLSSTGAFAYEGGWYFSNNPGGSEILSLGDNSDDTYLHLRGTSSWCGARGSSYARMRGIIDRNYPAQLTWWINRQCGNYLRICVENVRGESGCSTYYGIGWRSYR